MIGLPRLSNQSQFNDERNPASGIVDESSPPKRPTVRIYAANNQDVVSPSIAIASPMTPDCLQTGSLSVLADRAIEAIKKGTASNVDSMPYLTARV